MYIFRHFVMSLICMVMCSGSLSGYCVYPLLLLTVKAYQNATRL